MPAGGVVLGRGAGRRIGGAGPPAVAEGEVAGAGLVHVVFSGDAEPGV